MARRGGCDRRCPRLLSTMPPMTTRCSGDKPGAIEKSAVVVAVTHRAPSRSPPDPPLRLLSPSRRCSTRTSPAVFMQKLELECIYEGMQCLLLEFATMNTRVKDLLKEVKQVVNAIMAVSLAVCKVGATVKNVLLYQHITNLVGNKQLVLPVPAFNVINGGSHAGNNLAMQEFMILPTGASSFKEAM